MAGGFGDFSFLVVLAFVVFAFAAFGVILVLWIAVPFSVFGTKGLLKRVIEEQERTNRILSSIEAGMKRLPEIEAGGREGPSKAEDKGGQF